MNCIEWTGRTFTTHGNTYGVFSENGVEVLAHRRAYEDTKGPISAGMVIDHICRNGLCVRPEHLEAVTNRENILRGEGLPARNARKTHCYRGHEFTPENTHMSPQDRRICKSCRKLRSGVQEVPTREPIRRALPLKDDSGPWEACG